MNIEPGNVNWEEVGVIIGVVIGAVIMLVIGLGGASIAGGVVRFILGQLNTTSVTIPGSYNYLNQANGSIGTTAGLTGTLLIVVVAVAMIYLIMTLFTSWFRKR